MTGIRYRAAFEGRLLGAKLPPPLSGWTTAKGRNAAFAEGFSNGVLTVNVTVKSTD
jgi:hypothetical protein